MARQVISQNDLKKMQQPAAPGVAAPKTAVTEADSFMDRLLKYIPGEIVAVYILVKGIIEQMGPTSPNFKTISWIVFIVFCILTPLYLWRLMNVNKITQLIISFVAYIVWVFALGGPFTTLGWYDPIYGEILLPIFTLVIAIIVAEK